MRATRFVVVCFGRTGSSWLCSLLQSHPAILCHGELFSPKGIQYGPGYLECSETAPSWSIDSRDRDPSGFLDALFSEDLGHQAVGLKMLNWHQPEFLFDLVRRQDLHKVIVCRHNRIRAFLSRARSEMLEQWIGRSYDGFRIVLDPDELLAYVHRYDSFYDRLRAAAAGTPTHEVVYEALLEDDRPARSIVEFLGVEPSDFPLYSALQRQSGDVTREVVVNFEELARILRGTPLQAELEA